jgi:hypothetical protein
VCVTAILAAGCTQSVGGTAVRSAPGIDEDSRSPVDVETVLLDDHRMQAVTGAGQDLTAVPGMDSKSPVDIDMLAKDVPPQCAWLFAETQVFGSDVEEFHKTTYQDPPRSGLISQAAAGYRDAPTAHRALDAFVGRIGECSDTETGSAMVGVVDAGADTVHFQPGNCGRDYQVKSVVLVEVTSCGFPASVPRIVMSNILANVPA